MANPIVVNQNTTLVQVDTSIEREYIIRLSSLNTPGSLITIRDIAGNASSTYPIIISTTQGVNFLDGGGENSNIYRITQPYGFLTITPKTSTIWGLLNTFGFPDASAAANINTVTASSITVNNSYLNNTIISTALISTLSTEYVFVRENISVGHSTIAHAGFYTCTLRSLDDMITGGTLYAGSTVSSMFANITSSLTVPYISTQNIEMYGVLRSSSTISTMGPLFVGNSISTTGNLAVGGSTFIQGSLTVPTISTQNIEMYGVLRSSSTISTMGPLFVGNSISTTGNLAVGGSTFIQGSLTVLQNVIFQSSLKTSSLTVDGSVGIGTISPAFALDVNGSINFTGVINSNGSPVAFTPPGINSAGNIGINKAAGTAALDVSGTIHTSGAATFDGFVSAPAGLDVPGILSCAGNANFDGNGGGTVTIGPSSGTASKLLVYGKLGIGITTPVCALDVNGTINTNGGSISLVSNQLNNLLGAPMDGLGYYNETLPGFSGFPLKFGGFMGTVLSSGNGGGLSYPYSMVVKDGNIGVGVKNPTAKFQVIGNTNTTIVGGLIIPATISFPGAFYNTIMSALDYLTYNVDANVMIEIGSANVSVGNFNTVYKYLLGTSFTDAAKDSDFIIQAGGVGATYTTYTLETILKLNRNQLAIGLNAGKTSQGANTIAIGVNAGTNIQGSHGIAIGVNAGQGTQGIYTVAIGVNAGYSGQLNYAVAIGSAAGETTQGTGSVAIGNQAGQASQNTSAIAIGVNAGNATQGQTAVAIGESAGQTTQGIGSVAIGANAGQTGQLQYAVAIGINAGLTGQQGNAIAIGVNAGNATQGQNAIAMGSSAGVNQLINAVAIGNEAGRSNQLANAVAIGNEAGKVGQGANSIAIGNLAGQTSQIANSIIINASGVALNNTTSGLFMKPIATSAGTTNLLRYDTGTSEITYTSVDLTTTPGINTSGNIGINKAAGTVALDVSGSINFTGVINSNGSPVVFTPPGINSAGNIGINKAAGAVALDVSGTIHTSGAATFDGFVSAPAGLDVPGILSCAGNANFDGNGGGTVTIGPSSGTASKLLVYGKLGIGITTPVCALDVNGTINTNGGSISLVSNQLNNLLGAPMDGLGYYNETLPGFSGFPLKFGGFMGTVLSSGNGVGLSYPYSMVVKDGNVGVGVKNPTAKFQVIGNTNSNIVGGLIIPATITNPGENLNTVLSVVDYCTYNSPTAVTMEIGSANAAVGNLNTVYKYLMGVSFTGAGSDGNFIIQAGGVGATYTTYTLETILKLNRNQLAIGANAGLTSQGANAMAIGVNAGQTTQGTHGIAIGVNSGKTNQGIYTVAIGVNAGYSGQLNYAVAIGPAAGETTQGTNSVAIGNQAGQNSQNPSAIAIGVNAGNANQGQSAVAIGESAGQTTQGIGSIAIGGNAGQAGQQGNTVALGVFAGQTTQQGNAIAIGNQAGSTTQGSNAIAIGAYAGKINQEQNAVAIGIYAGESSQGSQAVAIGEGAGKTSQKGGAIAIGGTAGKDRQSTSSIAIGFRAGETDQGVFSVAIGLVAGNVNQGIFSVAIGTSAGETSQADYSIILNASGSALNSTSTGFFVKPIRNLAGSTYLMYNTSGEITHGSGVVSDERLKTNINTLSNVLSSIKQIRGVRYNFKDNLETLKIGVIAQEMEVVFPELVYTDESDKKIKSMDYPSLTGVLLQGIKEQQVLIESQQALIESHQSLIGSHQVLIEQQQFTLLKQADEIESLKAIVKAILQKYPI